jgi:hypothetical protein
MNTFIEVLTLVRDKEVNVPAVITEVLNKDQYKVKFIEKSRKKWNEYTTYSLDKEPTEITNESITCFYDSDDPECIDMKEVENGVYVKLEDLDDYEPESESEPESEEFSEVDSDEDETSDEEEED